MRDGTHDDPDSPEVKRLTSVNLRTGEKGESQATHISPDAGPLEVGAGPFGVASGRLYAPLMSLPANDSDGASTELLPAAVQPVDPRTLEGTPHPLMSPGLSRFWDAGAMMGGSVMPAGGIGDEAYVLPSNIGQTRIVLREGRHIAVVWTTRPEGKPEAVAKVVARNLRRLGG